MVIGEEVELAGTMIRAETVQNEDVVTILPRDKRVKAFMDLKRPETKKEMQVMCFMISSLQQGNPSLPLNQSMFRKQTVGKGKIELTDELEVEYQNAIDIMKTRIKLSPYDPTKRLRLIINGGKTVGTGFVICQYINEENPSKGVNIIHAGADKFEPGKTYSPVEAEAIALSRAMEACHH